jgi:hypothetical protein
MKKAECTGMYLSSQLFREANRGPQFTEFNVYIHIIFLTVY